MIISKISTLVLAANEDLWKRESPIGNMLSGEPGSEPRYEDGDILQLFKDFYKLEYAYSQVSISEVNYKRKEVILSKIGGTLEEVSNELKSIFVEVFKDWLAKHALLSPVTWGKQRAEDTMASGEGFEYAWGACVGEFLSYSSRNISSEQEYKRYEKILIEEIMEEESIQSILSKAINTDAIKQDEINNLIDEWESDPEEVISLLSLPEDADQRDVEAAAEKYVEETFSISDFISNFGSEYIFEEFKNLTEQDQTELLTQIYALKVFPIWYAKWSKEGIEKTRALVEKAYNILVKAKTPQQIQSAVNHATNVSHQTGSMLQYIANATDTSETALKKVWDSLTKGSFTEEVNKDLKSIGVAV